ncbi:TPA: S-layer protein [Serratia marcescens]|nr:S-layer protein [Serratia marcescens]
MDTMQLSDQQPAGKYVSANDKIILNIQNLSKEQSLYLTIGFNKMYDSGIPQQENELKNGYNEVISSQDGPIFFRLTESKYDINKINGVKIKMTGGKNLPLFIYGSSTNADWKKELSIYKNAPFVQLLSNRVIITLPSKVHASNPITEPSSTFSMIHSILDFQSELSGFDGIEIQDRPSPLRHHFLVDFRSSNKAKEEFYMYATDEFIGMLPENAAELTNPKKLSYSWAIWHEIGHTYQQESWTWNSLTEINVNIFSLYIQEKLGGESRIAIRENGEPSAHDQAQKYIAKKNKSYIDDNEDEVFIKLVMFEELKDKYGWNLFTELFKYFRSTPLPRDASDDTKIHTFVSAICEITGDDLRTFFDKWGIPSSAC